MRTIKIITTAEVPDGPLCADYRNRNGEICGYIQTLTMTVNHQQRTTYHCNLFNAGLEPKWGVQGFLGLSLAKCGQCAALAEANHE